MKTILQFIKSNPLKSSFVALLILSACAKVDPEPRLSNVTLHIYGSHYENGKQLMRKVSGSVFINEASFSVIRRSTDTSFKLPPTDIMKVNISGIDSNGGLIDTISLKVDVNGVVTNYSSTRGNCTTTISLK